MNSVVYTASHAHECRNIGSFSETDPISWYHANAFSRRAVHGQHRHEDWNAGRWPASPPRAHLAFHPTFDVGSFTGQFQAGWTVSGNSDYVVYGGEFPYVNDRAQQGLVRFAMPSIAPNKVGPESSGSLTPTATAIQGAVRLSWTSTWDRDNEYLTYRVYRDNTGTTPACEVTGASRWWNMPAYGCSDTGATAGSHRYLVSVRDAFGNTVDSGWTTSPCRPPVPGRRRAPTSARSPRTAPPTSGRWVSRRVRPPSTTRARPT